MTTSMQAMQREKEEIAARATQLGEWFHNLDLKGVQTAPHHFLGDYPKCKYEKFAASLPHDLRGKTVLDIGCNGGFYSIEMKRRGAEKVVGVDADKRYLAQAKFAAEVLGLEIEFRNLSVYEVEQLGQQFDVVLFMGVLYHLRYPLLALDLIRQHVAGDLLVFQAMQRGSKEIEPIEEDYPFAERAIFSRESYPRLFFVEESYAGDPTNWWIPNRACVEAMLRSSGFTIESNPEEEVYLCRKTTLSHFPHPDLESGTKL